MKILLISLGCDKNLVDAEKMMGILNNDGFAFTNDEEEADVVIVNTCCFIGDAKEESINTILEMAALKETAVCKVLIVTGCLAERYKDEVLKEIPEVDSILGTTSYEAISQVIDEALNGLKKEIFQDINYLPTKRTERILSTGGHYAFLKIAEGCDKHCTYCIIPKVRGAYRSVPIEILVKEAQSLADKGVKELILVAQETTLYGVDLYKKKSLPRLLEALAEIEDIKWIRLQYCYPEEITDELILVMKKQPKICSYLDIPIQHASNKILRLMGRKTNRASIEEIINKLRNEIPEIVLRTTMMTGFPGETEADFSILKEFIKMMRFDRLGVFAYSREEDTAAAIMQDQVPEEIKAARRDELMQIQQAIAFDLTREKTGRIFEVMIEGRLPDEDCYVGRTYMDSPEVDGYFFVTDKEEWMTGDFVKALATEASEYDLIGEVIE